MKGLKCLLFAFCVLDLSAQLPSPSKVVTLDKNTIDETKKEYEILGEFATVYSAKKQPRLTVLWNKRFNDKFSDWELSPAQSLRSETLDISSAERNLSADFRSKFSTLVRKYDQQKVSPTETQIEDFKAGFINTLLLAKVRLVDRDTIIRLTVDRKSASSDAHEMDSKQIETDALLNNTDYILELVFLPTKQHLVGFKTVAQVKSVKTGQIVVNVVNSPSELNPTHAWVLSDQGFSKITKKTVPPTFESLGTELAYATMSKLNEQWGR